MASAGTVSIELDANSVKLLRELQKSQRATKRTGAAMRRNMKRAFSAIASGAAIAAGALTKMAISGIRSADQLAKTASKLGTTATELAGLRFAAEQTGVEMRTLDMGLQRFIRRLQEASQGSGEAQDTLKQLGIDARESPRMSKRRRMHSTGPRLRPLGLVVSLERLLRQR